MTGTQTFPGGPSRTEPDDRAVIPPDPTSPARLALRPWTAPQSTVQLLELLAEDTETLARVRLDLSAPQARALREALGQILATV